MPDLSEWADDLTDEERVLLRELRTRSAAVARAIPPDAPGWRRMIIEHETAAITRRLAEIASERSDRETDQ